MKPEKKKIPTKAKERGKGSKEDIKVEGQKKGRHKAEGR